MKETNNYSESDLRRLSKAQANSIACLTSSIFEQNQSWVLRVIDLQTGVERLIRDLSQKAAKKRLSRWRKEKVEELLREEREAEAYLLRVWEENPQWGGQGIWQWAQSAWYTTREEAENALESYKEKFTCEVYQTTTENIPGNFQVV